MNQSENGARGHCGVYRCDLCWEPFTTAQALADHVEQEQWTLYPMALD